MVTRVEIIFGHVRADISDFFVLDTDFQTSPDKHTHYLRNVARIIYPRNDVLSNTDLSSLSALLVVNIPALVLDCLIFSGLTPRIFRWHMFFWAYVFLVLVF